MSFRISSLPIEPYTDLDALAGRFELSAVSLGPARYDPAELTGLNARLLHLMSYERARPRLAALGLDDRALTDLGWWGYDPRAAVPHVMVAAAVSAALLAGRWYFEMPGGALAVYALVLAVWPGLLGVALYRAVTYTYRLTDRALLVDWGLAFPAEPPAWLADVTGVVTLPAGTEMVMPGDNARMTVELIQPIAMDEGLRFAIREGGRTVGAGVVTKIVK